MSEPQPCSASCSYSILMLTFQTSRPTSSKSSRHFAAATGAFFTTCQLHLQRIPKSSRTALFLRDSSDTQPCVFVNVFIHCVIYLFIPLSIPLASPRQRCAWWTAAPTDRASAVCVSARRAGRGQNASRGTVTHAASTTASAGMASVTATRAGRANTAPSVRVTHSQRHTHTHIHTQHKAMKKGRKYDL